MGNWIDDELSRTNNNENLKNSFYNNYFKKHLDLKPLVDDILAYVNKLEQLHLKIDFCINKDISHFEYQFTYSAPNRERRILSVKFKENAGQPNIFINFDHQIGEGYYEDEYLSDGSYNEYAELKYRVREISTKSVFVFPYDIDNIFIANILGWVCFKNNNYGSPKPTVIINPSSKFRVASILSIATIVCALIFFVAYNLFKGQNSIIAYIVEVIVIGLSATMCVGCLFFLLGELIRMLQEYIRG